jgi:hypothetical protein
MKTDAINRWLSLAANIGVMLGLVLVAYQIRQDVELTKVQLFSDATSVMDAYLVGAVNELRRLELLETAGLDVNVEVEGLHHFFFGSRFAKAWYEKFREPGYLPYYYDEQIRAMDNEWIERFFERVRVRLDDNAQ